MDSVIKVSLEVRDRLKQIGAKGESYSDIIARLIDDGPTAEDIEIAQQHLDVLRAIEAIEAARGPMEEDLDLAEKHLAILRAIEASDVEVPAYD